MADGGHAPAFCNDVHVLAGYVAAAPQSPDECLWNVYNMHVVEPKDVWKAEVDDRITDIVCRDIGLCSSSSHGSGNRRILDGVTNDFHAGHTVWKGDGDMPCRIHDGGG